MALATGRKTQVKELPLGDYPPKPEKACASSSSSLVASAAMGQGLWVLNGVPAAVEHEFGLSAVQCESQAPLDLRPVVDVEELEMQIGE